MADQDLSREAANSIGDFIFGTLSTTERRVESIVADREGISAPVVETDPYTLTIRVTVGAKVPVNNVFLVYTREGSDPVGDKAEVRPLIADAPVWDTLTFGYLRPYHVHLPALPKGGILRYRVVGQTASGALVESSSKRRDSIVHAARGVPDWIHETVLYHIFVDRFSTDGGKPFATPDHPSGFYGGTLRGVIERLDYLSDLGVNALWLSPIFKSPSHHGYDSTDFLEIEPRLGTKDDLRTLIEAAHARQIRVLLDFVPNHVSNEHPYFVSAASEEDSPYRAYFTFTQWPDAYEAFFGVKSLPQINNEHPEARRYVIESALYWLREFGIDGFRLDYALGPSQDFWGDYYRAVKEAYPDSYHVGEIVDTPEVLRSYTGRLDGALDFLFLQNVRKTFAYRTLDVESFDVWLHTHEAYFRDHAFTLPTFLDNHDLNRFLWVAGHDKARLRLAALLQFTLSPTPILYYGTEIGHSQERDTRQGAFNILEESRLPMPWAKADPELLAYYKRLIAIRKSILPLLKHPRQTILVNGATGQYVYGYPDESGKLTVLVLLNNGPESATLTVTGVWQDAFSGAKCENSVTLAPNTGTLLIAD
jgi:glycosidase